MAAISDHHALHSRVYTDALSAGDGVRSYSTADPRFKAVYTEDQLVAYFENHPNLFRLPMSVSITRQSHNGEVILSTSFNTNQGKRMEIFVADAAGRLKLLGIAPDMADAIPNEIRNMDIFGGDFF